MKVTQFKPGETGALGSTPSIRSAFFDPNTLPWADWVMPGTWFKLLGINPMTGGFSIILKVAPDNHAPVHGHLGAVEGIILEGGFSYGEDHGYAGNYVFEGAGIRHEPNTHPGGLVMFAVIHSPLCGYNADGTVAGIVDARLMYEMAAAAGAAGHIDKPLHWV
jgi:2,4'-dihydroxyacetophenone dioxygenase